MHNLNRINTLATALVLLAGSVPVLAQNAMGDGRGLERDLRIGGTGNFARPNFMNEVRARNALVTGNAGSGQSLRINPGYTAPDEFRGTLGSDDLFSFRRDSIQSAPGFRGTQGLQYQSAYSIGNSAAVVTRLDQFGSGAELPRSGFTPREQFGVPRLRSDNPNSLLDTTNTSEQPASLYRPTAVSTLRSTGAFTSTISLSPAMVGVTQGESGLNRFAASSLLGVRSLDNPSTADLPDNRLTARELAERNAEPPRANSAAGPDMRTATPERSAASPAFRTAYDDLRMRMDRSPADNSKDDVKKEDGAGNSKDPKSNMPEWERRINELRDRLREGGPDEPAPKAAPTPTTAPTTPVAPKAGTAGERDRLEKASDEARAKRAADERDRRKKALAGLDDETLAIIKKGGGEANRYTSGTPGSLFDVHVREGEDALAKGRYFDAEERFARALAMRPGDVTVMAARLNSQVGAGLYLSAAVNLRQLMETHPEIMGVRYTGGAMPAAARLNLLKEELKRALDKSAADNGPIPEESALLLAYIGFQTTDRESVRQGLDTLARSPSGDRDPLIPVLRRVWLEETTDKGK